MVAPPRRALAYHKPSTTAPCHDSTDSRDEDQDAPNNSTSDVVAMLVQDWLRASSLSLTLQCFVDERERLGKTLPGPDKWFSLVEQLQFRDSECTRRAFTTSGTQISHPLPLLESVVQFVVTERQQIPERQHHQQQRLQPQQQPTVVVSKRVMQVKELKLLGKRRELSGAASAPAFRDFPGPSVHNQGANRKASSGLRPKSAAVCSSTSELIAMSVLGGRSPTTANQESPHKGDRASGDPHDIQQLKPRPISASTVSSTSSRLSISRQRRPTESQKLDSQAAFSLLQHHKSFRTEGGGDVSQLDRHASRSSLASLSLIMEDKISKQPAQTNDLENDPGEADTGAGPETPTLELEDMTEERLTAQFSSLDKFAIKKLRRVLAKSSACTQEFDKAKRTVDKIQAKAKLRQERRILAAEQTQLLSHTMDALNKEPCALCQHVFLKTNLVMKVSFKSILDLQRSWVRKSVGSEDEAAQGESSGQSPEGELDPAVTDDRILGRAQQAHLYDEVPICAFCSQLVLHFSSYRVRSVQAHPISVVPMLTLSVCDPAFVGSTESQGCRSQTSCS